MECLVSPRGFVELETFEQIQTFLQTTNRLSPRFWAEADRDRSQLISFEEFLLFYYRLLASC